MTELLIAFATLTVLEVVLGVDNVIFISILSGKLPVEEQDGARRLGLIAAMAMRILLLFLIVWVVRLTRPLVSIAGKDISGRDLILIGGGLNFMMMAKMVAETPVLKAYTARITDRPAFGKMMSEATQK